MKRNRERRDKALDRATIAVSAIIVIIAVSAITVILVTTVFIVDYANACGDVEQVETVTIEGNAL